MKSRTYKWSDGTPKSKGNAFDWQGQTSYISQQSDFAHLNRVQQQLLGKTEVRVFPTFTKAVPNVSRQRPTETR